jgi:dipeptidyl-peptidase-4
VLRIDPTNGSHEVLLADHDADWVELVAGTPGVTESGALVTCADRDGARRLCLDGQPVTPADLQVRTVLACGARIVFAANPISEPRRLEVWEHDPITSVTRCLVGGEVSANAVVSADGTTMVVRTARLDAPASTVVHSASGTHPITSNAEVPLVDPRVSFHRVGDRSIETAILVPTGGGAGPWPVIFDPYGGPHAQRVVEARNAYLSAQWLADQGFVVVIADGRGTPGRGSAWERALHGDLASCVLADQIAVLDALPDIEPRADTNRVAIMGWSFGGYLAALAVLRAPERFHCAVAGAPVCDWSLYDTHYTERYLGAPGADPEAYRRSSLIDDAARLERPLLLIHGLADDNVVAAHTLRLSAALLAAGRPHEVLPLSGVTHMTPQETVAENLLLHEIGFIRRHLAV